MSNKSKPQRQIFRRSLGFALAAAAGLVVSILAGEPLTPDSYPRIIPNLFSALLVLLVAYAVGHDFSKKSLSYSRDQLLRRAPRLLLIGAVLLVGLELFFVRNIEVGDSTVPVVISWSWNFPELTAQQCVERVNSGNLGDCWNYRPAALLALALAYFATLLGLGAVAGLLIKPLPPRSLGSNLWVRVEPTRQGTYRVSARDDGGGESSATFRLSESLRSLEGFIGTLEGPVRGNKSFQEVARKNPRSIGGALFETMFQGNVRAALYSALERDKGQSDPSGLRIRLSLQHAPELAVLPWEYLYDEENYGYFAQSRATPIVRSLESVKPYEVLQVEPPLKLLIVTAEPEGKGWAKLGVDKELRHIEKELEPLKDSIVVEKLQNAIWETLAERLRDKSDPIHVLHFIGHGGHTSEGEGALVFESATGEKHLTTGDSLASGLKDHGSIRLAVLNACEGARATESRALAGVAHRLLVSGELPAVVAMQIKITDSTARTFARLFYNALAYGYPLDAALSEVRKTLSGQGNKEWGTPVVYLRAPDATLFDVKGRKPKRWEKDLRKERERAGQDSSND